MKTKIVALGILASSIIGCAQSYNSYNDNNYGHDLSDTTQYVKVVASNPVYENVTQRLPYEECRNVNVPVNSGSGSSDIENGLGTFIGGVAGGILGHQIGGGNGKTVATIGGAIIGSAIGNSLSNRNGNRNGRVYYEQRRVCEQKYRESTKRVLSGYNNIGYYNGQKIVKFSQQRMRTIPVTVSISY